jgi:uncharacterized protein with HEPN domain
MAIELIEEFIVDDKDFTLYDQDRKTQSAVERQLAIIGEALNQFKKLEPEVKIENDKQIISFRNRLVHAYDSLDNSMIWVIISKHLTPLKIEIQKLV